MEDADACASPLEVATVDGRLIVRAPGGAELVAMTPRAALETADRLFEAARAVLAATIEAKKQRGENASSPVMSATGCCEPPTRA